jgi:hypothetical protein
VKSTAHYRFWRDLPKVRPGAAAALRREPLRKFLEAIEALRAERIFRGAIGLMEVASCRCIEPRCEAFFAAIAKWRRSHLLPLWCEAWAQNACDQWSWMPPEKLPWPMIPVQRPKGQQTPKRAPGAAYPSPADDPQDTCSADREQAWLDEGRAIAARMNESAEQDVEWQHKAARADYDRSQRESFKALPAEQRRKEGPRRAQRKRWKDQKPRREAWRDLARELKTSNKNLKVSEAARLVQKKLEGSHPPPGGALSTIRGAIRDLWSAR